MLAKYYDNGATLLVLRRKAYTFAGLAILAVFLLYNTTFFYPARPSVDTFAGKETTLAAHFKPHDADFHAEDDIKNVAVIIEDRLLTKLVPLILHFSSVLGPEWPIILFTSQNITPTSAAFKRAITSSQISVQSLPADVQFTDHSSVSEFLTSSWLWEQLAPADHVLLFQADSIVCANSPVRVDDFLSYDFIGAPIDPKFGQGYNGGLSLRNRSMVLEIVQEYSWKDELGDAIARDAVSPSAMFEDQWFYKKMRELPMTGDGKPGARLPSLDVAMNFSVETVWFERPWGFHQVARWQERHVDEVDEWCPEHRIVTNDLLVSHGNR